MRRHASVAGAALLGATMAMLLAAAAAASIASTPSGPGDGGAQFGVQLVHPGALTHVGQTYDAVVVHPDKFTAHGFHHVQPGEKVRITVLPDGRFRIQIISTGETLTVGGGHR